MSIEYINSNPSLCLSYDKDGNFIGFDGFHKINGVWTHIAQVFENGNTKFYTDGKLEE